MLVTVVIFAIVPAAITYCAGHLTARPWASLALMAALALPLNFINSPLGPIGPATFALVLVGSLTGAIAARFVSSSSKAS